MENEGSFCKKSGAFLNAGCIMYSISIFILHFTYLGGSYVPNTPLPCLRACICVNASQFSWRCADTVPCGSRVLRWVCSPVCLSVLLRIHIIQTWTYTRYMLVCCRLLVAYGHDMQLQYCGQHRSSVGYTSDYIRWVDVTESKVTIRSPFCGYILA